MTPEELQVIRERVDKATSGPWVASLLAGSVSSYEVRRNPAQVYGNAITGWGRVCQPKEDAEFIAHAREDVPKLLDEVERLRGALENIELLVPSKPTRNNYVPLNDVVRVQKIARQALEAMEK